MSLAGRHWKLAHVIGRFEVWYSAGGAVMFVDTFTDEIKPARDHSRRRAAIVLFEDAA